MLTKSLACAGGKVLGTISVLAVGVVIGSRIQISCGEVRYGGCPPPLRVILFLRLFELGYRQAGPSLTNQTAYLIRVVTGTLLQTGSTLFFVCIESPHPLGYGGFKSGL